MGFLKKLFEKKDCEICGGEIGLLGNTKLADGDMCRDCAAKLSPLFRVTDETTVADILGQIAYREENKTALEAFNPDEEFGTEEKILVDTAAKKLAYARSGDWKGEEADVIDFSQVRAVETDEEEEMMYFDHDAEDDEEACTTEIRVVHFHVTLRVDSPYFDKIEVCLSNGETPTLDGDDTDIAKYREFERQSNRLAELFGA